MILPRFVFDPPSCCDSTYSTLRTAFSLWVSAQVETLAGKVLPRVVSDV